MNFETNAEDMFIKMVKTKKYGGFYSVRYDSPVTGKLTHVSIKKSLGTSSDCVVARSRLPTRNSLFLEAPSVLALWNISAGTYLPASH